MSSIDTTVAVSELRLDLGSGPRPRHGFVGVDRLAFDGVTSCNLGSYGWPFAANSVDEAWASHVVEHLTAEQRVRFCNELYRVLKPHAICTVTVPHWASHRAYGDLTHQWPPVSESWFPYLNAQWRDMCAPHTDFAHDTHGYSCDFEVQWAPAFREDIAVRNPEYQRMAAENYKDVILDMVAVFTKRG